MKEIITNDNIEVLFDAIDNNQPLDNFDTSQVTDMYAMFKNSTQFNLPLDSFDTSNVTNMGQMFCNATSFNQPINNFNTSKVHTMLQMFADAQQFNQPLTNFDTSNVLVMNHMFCNATNFNQPIDHFDVSRVCEMSTMFKYAKSMFIGYIMRFVSKVIYTYKRYMAMSIEYAQFSNSRELDEYIIHIYYNISNTPNNKLKIQSAIDGFIVD